MCGNVCDQTEDTTVPEEKRKGGEDYSKHIFWQGSLFI